MAKQLKRWRVSRIKGNAAYDYGTVEAATAEEAIKKIVGEEGISDPEMLKRLTARPV
jgi:hypothetical protein